MSPEDLRVRAPVPLQMEKLSTGLPVVKSIGWWQINLVCISPWLRICVHVLQNNDYSLNRTIYKGPNFARGTGKISKYHIPQVIGCIDGTHIPALAPSNGYWDFVNRKGWTSYDLQGVVDEWLIKGYTESSALTPSKQSFNI